MDPHTDLSSIPNPTPPNSCTMMASDEGSELEFESIWGSLIDFQFRLMVVEETVKQLHYISAKEKEEVDVNGRDELLYEIETVERDRVISRILDSVRSANKCLCRIGERISGETMEGIQRERAEFDDELQVLALESDATLTLSEAVESKFSEYEETRSKEKKELENRIVSLSEENIDMGRMLRVALLEKEGAGRNRRKFKGGIEQKKGGIMQLAEIVGFGFFTGFISGDESNAGAKSDSSECEEETATLASTVEKVMKKLRLEISDLRRALDESRSENDNLQTTLNKQAQMIAEGETYIKNLEEREQTLANSVEEMGMEIKEAEAEIIRWREACELEVKAGKAAVRELEKEVGALKFELQRTKSALNSANNKLFIKEKLATTAMAAQAAAEATLQLADKRAAELRARIEELTRQMDDENERSRRERNGSRRKARHFCWPWQTFTVFQNSYPTPRPRRKMLPEMESLMHFHF